jgi:hypothetical protein
VRKGIVLVLVATVTTTLGALPVDAKSKAPTAKALVQKLIKAGVCKGPVQAVDALGTTVSCTAQLDLGSAPPPTGVAQGLGDPFQIEIHAYKTPAALLSGLEKGRVADCVDQEQTFGFTPDTVRFSVGKNWWTSPYLDQIGIPLRKTLGGKVKTYGCS